MNIYKILKTTLKFNTMTREQRLFKKGYRVLFVMNTSVENNGKCKVAIRYRKNLQGVYTSISAAHKAIFGY